MNALFKTHGYLDGEPGAYALTDKGREYGDEEYNTRGTGGYAHYNRAWTTRTWAEGTAAALKAEMEANPAGVRASEEVVAEREAPTWFPAEGDRDVFESSPAFNYNERDDAAARSVFGVAVVAGAVIGIVVAVPHAIQLWKTKVKPSTQALRGRFSRRESGEVPDTKDEL